MMNLLSESCLFYKYITGYLIIIIFVDDILIAAERITDVTVLASKFKEKFSITDSGEVNVYLSINIPRQFNDRVIILDQTSYIL